MSNVSCWQVDVRVPDSSTSLPVAVRVAQTLRHEARSLDRVGLEICHRRGEKRFGFLIKIEATDRGAAAACGVLATIRAFEAEGLPAPAELTVRVRSAEPEDVG